MACKGTSLVFNFAKYAFLPNIVPLMHLKSKILIFLITKLLYKIKTSKFAVKFFSENLNCFHYMTTQKTAHFWQIKIEKLKKIKMLHYNIKEMVCTKTFVVGSF